ncbi:MAG: DUF3482 domain-containing protein [Comamonadaceae bacterium]|nr:MAG: DUF3482 domain-containing protein [Comamonadaceae bacterium]
MSLDEPQARRIVLAQAIETGDAQGKLVSASAREAIDRQARHAARAGTGSLEQRLQAVLAQRAAQVVQEAGATQPALAALAGPPTWQRWLAFGLPLLTLLLGAFTDRISDPHRVDLLSQPLLAIVAWNLAIYAVLLVRWVAGLAARKSRPRAPLLSGLLRWADGLGQRRRHGNLRAEITALFTLHWHAATAALMQQRVSRVLHLAAAGWAAGVAVSLLARGLFVQYRVGWESTWLAADQVHAVLGWLFLPAVALFGFAPLSLQEVAALQVLPGGGHAPERRWVLMVAALLLAVVILPRLALAAWARWRESRLARAVVLDLQQPYFQALAAALLPAQVRLGLAMPAQEGPAPAQDAAALRRILLQQPRPGPETLIETVEGDTLALADGPAQAVDLWLQLVPPGQGIALPPQQPGPVLAFPADAIPRCWIQEPDLLQAIATALPPVLQPGLARLAAAWDARNRQRLGQSMSSLALQLLDAAREVQEVRSTPVSVQQLLLPADRQAHEQARQAAMAQVAQRLAKSSAVTLARLQQLHGLEPGADEEGADAPDHSQFLVQQSVNTPQAGIAGATTGAAMGASVDLLTGGLTLGAAAALGALVGGGAAFVAAAWKNRANAAGVPVVQPGDAMLHALAQAGLLRYLAVIHAARQPSGPGMQDAALWQTEVAAALETRRAALQAFWPAARTGSAGPEAGTALAAELEAACLQVLDRLYPRDAPV